MGALFRLLIITHLGLLSSAISDNAFYSYTDANVKIFATQNVRPNWPVMFSAIPQNTSKIAENATFQWVFENNALCTNQAVENSNCTNQVVVITDHGAFLLINVYCPAESGEERPERWKSRSLK